MSPRMTMNRSTHWFAGVLFTGLLACATAPTQPTVPPRLHVVQGSPAGISVNAYLVEGPTGVVAVDSALTVSDAKALRARLDALHKPLLAVLLTHGHPDHYNGVAILVEGMKEVPVYASSEVSSVVRRFDAAKEAQWKPMFADEWPTRRVFPNSELSDGARLSLDGMSWTLRTLGPGESHADSYWLLEAGGASHAFIGDAVLHGVHAYVSDGHTTQWLENLTRLRAELARVEAIHPGHGASGGAELLDWQRKYLETYRTEVESLRGTDGKLSEEQKVALTSRMKAKYPGAGLEFLIPLGADAVAAELSTP